jgi:hypothetical protein
VTDAWAARIKNAADQTSGWAAAWHGVSVGVSDAWDNLGKLLFPGEQNLPGQLAGLYQELADAKNGVGKFKIGGGINLFNWEMPRDVSEIVADINRVKQQISDRERATGESEGINRQADTMRQLGESYDPTTTALSKNRNERDAIFKAYYDGAIDIDKANQLLIGNGREYTKILKEQSEAEGEQSEKTKTLTSIQRQHNEEVQRLIAGSDKAVAEARLETSTATGRIEAYRLGSIALQDLNEQQEIAKATLPYVTALAWAHGDAYERLKKIIADVTAEKQKQIAADHTLAAMQDIDQQIGSASGTMSGGLADAKYAQAQRSFKQWVVTEAEGLMDNEADWDANFSKFSLILGKKRDDLYADNLRNHTDWASGIERANQELTRSQADWASKSEAFITGWASTGEDAFVKFATTGKSSLEDLANFAEQQFAKIAYQRYLASSFNAVGNMALNGIDSAFSSLDSLFGTSAGEHHTGGIAGSPSVTRTVPAAVFYGAQRYHGGGDVLPWLQTGEVPIIAKSGERVQTEVQAGRSDAAERAVAYISEMARPVTITLPSTGAAAAANQAPVEFHTHDARGIKLKTKETTTPNGGRRVDTVATMSRELENYLAGRISNRQGPLGAAISSTTTATSVVR